MAIFRSRKRRKLSDPAASIAPIIGGGPVFVEFGNSHAYLFDVYGSLPNAQFVNPVSDLWTERAAALAAWADIRPQLHKSYWRPFFLTIDAFLYDPASLLTLRDIDGVGIVHRMHERADRVLALRALTGWVRLCSYSPAVAAWVTEITGQVCTWLPHPPVFFKDVLPGQIKDLRDAKFATRAGRKINVSLVGEVRPGKGFEYVVEELGAAPALASCVKLHLVGGASSRKDVAAIHRKVSKTNLDCMISLPTRTIKDHRTVSNEEFTQTIQSTDIMLFPYSGEEAHSMSGHLVDSVYAGCRVLVSVESTMRELVGRTGIGDFFSAAKAGSLADALDKEIRREAFTAQEDEQLADFATLFSRDEINKQITNLIRR